MESQALALSPEPIVIPDTEPMALEGTGVVKSANALTITDNESYHLAAIELQRIARLKDSIVAGLADVKASAHATHKKITTLEATLLRAPEEAALIINRKVKAYDAEQERLLRVREAEIAAEAKARQDDAALAEAGELEAAGEHRAAEAVISEAAAAPAPVIQLPRPSAPGILSSRKNWLWEPKGEVSETKTEYLIRDAKLISGMVRRLGPAAEKIIGGIRVFNDPILNVRR